MADARLSRLVVRTASPALPANARVSRITVRTASTVAAAATAAQLTQSVVEVLSLPAAAGRVSQLVVEVLGGTTVIPPLTEARVSQLVTEVLGSSAPIGTRATQLVLEAFTAQPTPATRATQLVLEAFLPLRSPVRATQHAVEYLHTTPAALRATQTLVELFIRPQPRRLIRRLRRAPHVHDEHRRIAYAKFALDLQRGVGALMGQGADPVVTLRLSRDGGRTWGEPVRMRAGTLGAYTTRVLARRLGQARDAVFEVTVSDPVAWSLVQAWLDLEPGTS